jgi:transcriptional regulator GlxA family with amidase domain
MKYRDGDRDRSASKVLPGDVVRALNWLKVRLDEPVQVERLAEVAGVRPRTSL